MLCHPERHVYYVTDRHQPRWHVADVELTHPLRSAILERKGVQFGTMPCISGHVLMDSFNLKQFLILLLSFLILAIVNIIGLLFCTVPIYLYLFDNES